MKHNVEPNMGANSEALEFHDGIICTKLYKEFLSMKPSSWKKETYGGTNCLGIITKYMRVDQEKQEKDINLDSKGRDVVLKALPLFAGSEKECK